MTEKEKIPDKVDFYFDLGSPYSYLASTQLDAFEKENNIVFKWQPIFVGGLFRNVNNKSPFYVESKNKKEYLLNDLCAWSSFYGVPFTLPPGFPTNTLKAMRGAIIASHNGVLKTYAKAMFHAYFVKNIDIADNEVLISIVEKIGMDGSAFIDTINEMNTKQELISATQEATQRGAFGVPTFFYKNHIFFGNDRLVLLENLVQSEI